MLKLDDVSVFYGRVPAVRALSLEVAEGEIVSLVGPNGAGKTTTLLAIVGVLRRIRGTIEFEGESLKGRTPEQIVRSGIALVPEGRRIFADMTVEENLLVASSARRDRGAIHGEIDGLCERFAALGTYRHTVAGKLSGGEQQQLAIARALLAQPRLLLLDEPSLGLAPKLVEGMFALLRDLRERGVTILLVEQYAAQAVAVADRSYVLRSGALEISGTREELAGSDVLAKAYFGGVEDAA